MTSKNMLFLLLSVSTSAPSAVLIMTYRSLSPLESLCACWFRHLWVMFCRTDMLFRRMYLRAISSASYAISSLVFKSFIKYFQVLRTVILDVNTFVFGRMHVSVFFFPNTQSATNLSLSTPRLGSMKYGPDSISGWHNLRS